MSRLKSDKLAVRVYARHGDMCSGHIDGHCAMQHKADDFVLCAQFAYLQEGIDYAKEGARRGVSTRLVSRIVPTAPMTWNYPAERA